VLTALFVAARLSAQTAATELLVDFGPDAAGDVFGTSWHNVILSPACGRSSAGNSGLTQVTTGAPQTDVYLGIMGSARTFRYGDRVVATWYNTTEQSISFSPYISFTDPDSIVNATGQPRWFSMSIGVSARVPANGRLETALECYPANSTRFPAHYVTTGEFALVNIAPRTSTSLDPGSLVLEKIELRHDVDTVPPAVPQNLRIIAVDDTSVRLQWDFSQDAADGRATRYFIYVNGEFKASTHTGSNTPIDSITSYTDCGLTPGGTYVYEIEALDEHFNRSARSASATATTALFPSDSAVINPFTQLHYLGAFRLPNTSQSTLPYSTWAYGGRAIAFYPEGDPSGPADGYSGSLFGIGHVYESSVSEVSIPPPTISPARRLADLPRAEVLQDFSTAITYKDLVNPQIAQPILAYLPRQAGQDQAKLYLSYSEGYLSSKKVSLGWCNLDLSNPQTQGPWYIGSPIGDPSYVDYVGFMFEIPESWASVHTPGKRLLCGNYRPVALSGFGVSLLAIGPWNEGNPPPPDSGIAYTRLLRYGEYGDPDVAKRMRGGNFYGDKYRGGAWLTVGDRSAVVLYGRKGYGDGWYGMTDGNIEVPAIPAIPSPGNGHAPYATSYRNILTFYDPAPLAAAAAGRIPTWSPQPYAYFDLSPYMFSATSDAGGVAYDRAHRLLYLTETAVDNGRPIIHVFQFDNTTRTLFATWRTASFSGSDLTDDAISGPDADPDGCGLTNFARYAFSLPARGPVANPVTLGIADTTAGRVLTLSFPRRAEASDLTYTLEASTDLATWLPVENRTFGPGSTPFTAEDVVPLAEPGTPHRFLRLRVTTAP
jgi:hypothetical protein